MSNYFILSKLGKKFPIIITIFCYLMCFMKSVIRNLSDSLNSSFDLDFDKTNKYSPDLMEFW